MESIPNHRPHYWNRFRVFRSASETMIESVQLSGIDSTGATKVFARRRLSDVASDGLQRSFFPQYTRVSVRASSAYGAAQLKLGVAAASSSNSSPLLRSMSGRLRKSLPSQLSRFSPYVWPWKDMCGFARGYEAGGNNPQVAQSGKPPSGETKKGDRRVY